jgi:F420-dependent oxidoreductase-like protein
MAISSLAQFGVYLPQANVDYGTVRKLTTECERLGFSSVWLYDHVVALSSPEDPVLECWTTLSALAASTSRIRLGTLVLCNSFRHPPVLAKMAATLDYISGGRLDFGIGAGWFRPEYEAYGIPFPKASTRIAQLRESLEILTRMWTEDRATYEGQYYSVKEAVCRPRPTQRPHPPIWVGVMIGKRRMFDLIAQYADGWTISSLFLPTPTDYQKQLKALEERCQAQGRNLKDIRKALGVGCVIARDKQALEKKLERYQPGKVSLDVYQNIQSRLVGTTDELVERFREYEDAGATHFLINFPDVTDYETLQLFSDKVIKAMG